MHHLAVSPHSPPAPSIQLFLNNMPLTNTAQVGAVYTPQTTVPGPGSLNFSTPLTLPPRCCAVSVPPPFLTPVPVNPPVPSLQPFVCRINRVFGEEVPRPLEEVSDPVSTPRADAMVSPDSTGTVGHQSDSTDKKAVIDSAAPSISIGTQSVNMEPSAVDTGHQFFLGDPEVVSFSSLVAASVRHESDS